jgi:mercuric ion transport protein
VTAPRDPGTETGVPDSRPSAPTLDPVLPPGSRIAAGLAALACAACCALPVLIGAGVLTGAAGALARNLLLAGAGALLATAAGLWWLTNRRRTRADDVP